MRPARQWGADLARVTTAALAAYLAVTAYTLLDTDRSLFGVRAIALRPFYIVATVIGLAAAIVGGHRLWTAWAVAVTVCSFGRAMTLLIVGSPELRRAKELQGVFAWELHWLSGILCTLVAMAALELRGEKVGHRWHG